MDKVRFEVGKRTWLSHRIISYFLHHPGSFVSTMIVGGTLALVVYGILSAVWVTGVLPAGIVVNPFFLLLTQVRLVHSAGG